MVSIAQSGLLILLSLFLLLHVAILLKIIPYHLVWGGRLKSDKEMYRFEIFSILINSLFIVILLVHGGFLEMNIPRNVIRYAIWVMTGLFVLNTLGNISSKNKLEQRVFTPVTIILAVLSFILAWSH